MKINYLLIALLAVAIGACDIEKNPYTSKDSKEVINTPEGLEKITEGNYTILKGNNGDNAGWFNNAHRIGEYPGDNVSLSGTTSDALYYLYTYGRLATSYRVNNYWVTGYRAIVSCNKVIELAKEGESAEVDNLLGENYYLRALVYFNFANTFGRPYYQGRDNLAVPLKLSSDVAEIPARATVGQVYDQVVADLLKAESLMTLDNGDIRASKEAAEALLSRVYLYMNDNGNAILYADKVIQSGKYSLLSPDKKKVSNTLMPEDNSDDIMAFKMTSTSDYYGPNGDDYWYSVGSMYASVNDEGWGEMYASSSYLNLILQHPEDARMSYISPQFAPDSLGNLVPTAYWVDNTFTYKKGPIVGNTVTLNGVAVPIDSSLVDGRYVYTINEGGNNYSILKTYDMQERHALPKFYILKCSMQEGFSQLWSPVVSRLSEMYLNKAEAYAKQGNDLMAMDNVNHIRAQAGIPQYTIGNLRTGRTVLEVVLDERRLELAYEGQRKYDVYRNGLSMDREYPGYQPQELIDPSDVRIIEYIPEQQILIQPNLVQNP